ncbi:MAG: GNAT family N-acetyltransferase [Candidatus Binataceae bacterium]
MSAEIRIVEIRDRAQMERAHAIRRRVFIEEQHVPEDIELDEDDAHALHVLAIDLAGIAVGCGRMVAHDEEVKIGRMAVLRDRRGEGIGRRILEFLMEAARARGYRQAVLHAQIAVEGFYSKSGYRPVGDAFEEAGIMHRLMRHDL